MNIPINIHLPLFVLIVLSYFQTEPIVIQLEKTSVEIGKQIYSSGIGEGDQKIMAIVSEREISGSMMACINCHGTCGKSVALQGILIPDIRRDHYIERYLHDESSSDVSKAIQSKMKRAITLGIKYDDKQIHNMMPRYKMSMNDIDHLLAYLQVLGEDENCKED